MPRIPFHTLTQLLMKLRSFLGSFAVSLSHAGRWAKKRKSQTTEMFESVGGFFERPLFQQKVLLRLFWNVENVSQLWRIVHFAGKFFIDDVLVRVGV